MPVPQHLRRRQKKQCYRLLDFVIEHAITLEVQTVQLTDAPPGFFVTFLYADGAHSESYVCPVCFARSLHTMYDHTGAIWPIAVCVRPIVRTDPLLHLYGCARCRHRLTLQVPCVQEQFTIALRYKRRQQVFLWSRIRPMASSGDVPPPSLLDVLGTSVRWLRQLEAYSWTGAEDAFPFVIAADRVRRIYAPAVREERRQKAMVRDRLRLLFGRAYARLLQCIR